MNRGSGISNLLRLLSLCFVLLLGLGTIVGTGGSDPEPTVTIHSPLEGTAFHEGEDIHFAGAVHDSKDGTVTGASLVWTSTLNGEIGTGTAFTKSDLKRGHHHIHLTATDSDGLIGEASVNISVGSTIPVATITGPTDGSTFDVGSTITFTGSALDVEDGALSGSALAWTSDRDGQIGVGTLITVNDLSVGMHTITLTATDSSGSSGIDFITVTVGNTPPTASITNPADGSRYDFGDTVTFNGTGEDAEDGPLTGTSLVWNSSKDGQIGTGTSFMINTLTLGQHTITLTATDSDGDVDSDSIMVRMGNIPPTATIASPSDGSIYDVGKYIIFEGSGQDPEDGNLTGASLVWFSNVDGQIGTGTSFTSNALSQGVHGITLTATDKDGATDRDSITVTVGNTPPTATITSPANGVKFQEGDSITFAGSGVDTQDGTLTGASLVWTSSKNGQIGTGIFFTINTLSVGLHIITLTATDKNGAKGNAAVTIQVGNTPPKAIISNPANNSSYDLDDSVVFNGSATDAEDGALTGASLVWNSSKDGQIGTGTSLTVNTLSEGTHIITLTATDSDGAAHSASITIYVGNNPPTANITNPSDRSEFEKGAYIVFNGSGVDQEDGNLSGVSLLWTSSKDGPIGNGTSLTIHTLSEGTHIITLTATDSRGAAHSDSITITVGNKFPEANITNPKDGSEYPMDKSTVPPTPPTVVFTGTGNDPEDGTLTGDALIWTSSKDGRIGTGTSFTHSSLSEGSHIVTLTVTDSDGASTTVSINIIVGNTPPSANINSPVDWSAFGQGVTVSFVGIGVDVQDGTLPGNSLIWSSSIDGDPIGTGTPFSKNDLSVGTHTITLTVTDSDGATNSDSITVIIN